MKSKEEDRGPGARKTKLERHLNANAKAAKENFSPEGRSEDADREAGKVGDEKSGQQRQRR